LKSIFLLGATLTGYSLSYFNQGTALSTAAFIGTTILAAYCILRESLRRFRIRRIERRGYTFPDPSWRIEPDPRGRGKKFHLIWRGRRAPLSKSEIPILYELGELSRQGNILDLSNFLRRIHALRTGFKKDGWTIAHSVQPGVYTMYRADLTSLATISKLDASWLTRSVMNRPEGLLKRVGEIAARVTTYKHLTRHLKNVTYAGNHAVISTSNGQIYVDLHNGEVYKEDDWSGPDPVPICIVPLHEYGMSRESPVIQYGEREERRQPLEWRDAVILSKIFNISRETFQVKELLK